MATTIGIILAAGRGSRMKALTAEKPKCLLELAGRPLLHWQLEALRAAGLGHCIVVRGYRADMLTGDFATVDNPRWAETNMVQTMLCAFRETAGADVLVSYADIVYRPEHVRALLAQRDADIALTYDKDWESLWRLRNENPLDDAETFREENGRLLEIGGKPRSLGEVRGQYMGLLKFSPAGQNAVRDLAASLPPEQADNLDMTSLLRALLQRDHAIVAIPVHGGWCECDTAEDIRRYEAALTQKAWGHDWRIEHSTG